MAWYDIIDPTSTESIEYKSGKVILDVGGKILDIGTGTLSGLDRLVNSPILLIGGVIIIFLLIRRT